MTIISGDKHSNIAVDRAGEEWLCSLNSSREDEDIELHPYCSKKIQFEIKNSMISTWMRRRNFSFPSSSPWKFGSRWNSAPSRISSRPKVLMSSARRRISWPRSFAWGVTGVIRSGSLYLKRESKIGEWEEQTNLVLSSGLALFTHWTSAARKFLKRALRKEDWSISD